jgi:hypothetical protein
MALYHEASGRNVPFDVEIDGSVVRMIPSESLEAGEVYVAAGIQESVVEGSHSSITFLGWDYRSVSFTVGSDPTWLAALPSPDEESWLLVFSEPVDAADIGWMEVREDGLQQWIDLTEDARVYDGNDHILEVSVPRDPAEDRLDTDPRRVPSELTLTSGWAGDGLGETATMVVQPTEIGPYLFTPECY